MFYTLIRCYNIGRMSDYYDSQCANEIIPLLIPQLHFRRALTYGGTVPRQVGDGSVE